MEWVIMALVVPVLVLVLLVVLFSVLSGMAEAGEVGVTAV
jgi:hypothetical protein